MQMRWKFVPVSGSFTLNEGRSLSTAPAEEGHSVS